MVYSDVYPPSSTRGLGCVVPRGTPDKTSRNSRNDPGSFPEDGRCPPPNRGARTADTESGGGVARKPLGIGLESVLEVVSRFLDLDPERSEGFTG